MFVSKNKKQLLQKVGSNRFIFNRGTARFNSKSGISAVCVVSKKGIHITVKSQLVKRSSADLKKSRVSAYSYLIP